MRNFQVTFFCGITGGDYNRLQNYKITNFIVFVRSGGKSGDDGIWRGY